MSRYVNLRMPLLVVNHLMLKKQEDDLDSFDSDKSSSDDETGDQSTVDVEKKSRKRPIDEANGTTEQKRARVTNVADSQAAVEHPGTILHSFITSYFSYSNPLGF